MSVVQNDVTTVKNKIISLRIPRIIFDIGESLYLCGFNVLIYSDPSFYLDDNFLISSYVLSTYGDKVYYVLRMES